MKKVKAETKKERNKNSLYAVSVAFINECDDNSTSRFHVFRKLSDALTCKNDCVNTFVAMYQDDDEDLKTEEIDENDWEYDRRVIQWHIHVLISEIDLESDASELLSVRLPGTR